MTKKIVVAGSRNYNDYNEAKAFIELCLSGMEDDFVFISGCCNGADKLGERYAKENGYEIIRKPPEWDKYGKAAGVKRNREMVSESDIVICFWDGKSKGTHSTVKYARDLEKTLKIKYLD